MLKKIDNIGIAVRDIKASAAFFRDVLGLEVQEYEGRSSAGVTIGDCRFFVFQTSSAAPVGRTADYLNNPPGIDHISFEVDDLEADMAAMKAKGVSFLTEPWGGATAKYVPFHDPDGNVFYLLQRLG